MLKKLVVICTIAMVALLMAGTAWADSVPVNNASFENPGGLVNIGCGAGCMYNTIAPTGWLVSSGGSFQPGSFFSFVPDGILVAYTNSGYIAQLLTSSTVQPNTLYTMTVDVGHRTDGINGSFTLYLETVQNGLNTTVCSVSGNAANITPGGWQAESCSYQSGASAGGNFYLDFVANGGQLDVDNVSLVTSANVPEPSSVLMLGLGMMLVMGVALWSKREEFRFFNA